MHYFMTYKKYETILVKQSVKKFLYALLTDGWIIPPFANKTRKISIKYILFFHSNIYST